MLGCVLRSSRLSFLLEVDGAGASEIHSSARDPENIIFSVAGEQQVGRYSGGESK